MAWFKYRQRMSSGNGSWQYMEYFPRSAVRKEVLEEIEDYLENARDLERALSRLRYRGSLNTTCRRSTSGTGDIQRKDPLPSKGRNPLHEAFETTKSKIQKTTENHTKIQKAVS